MPDAEATAELFINLTDGLADRLQAVRTDIADEIRHARDHYDRSEQGERFDEIKRRHGIGSALMDVLTKATVRETVLSENIRIDGRDTATIRPINVEVGVLPRTHGSGLFQRGQTQALSIATLGPSSDKQRMDTISPETEKRYLHHYNMPPYSVGEAKFMRGPGRREIGHGALAERALVPVLPTEAEFPYVIRVVSEVVSSNGSTSMASTCGSTLALMDAGVPIKAPVAGAAMGLISDKATGRYAVLTDITGKEDAYGDMDFKVTGTAEGVTALQMDIKVAGITVEIMRDALEQARVARLFILDKMTAVIGCQPRGAVARSRRASPRSRSRSTRSATSSAPAARSSVRSPPRPAPRSTSRTTARSRSLPRAARPPRRRSPGSRASRRTSRSARNTLARSSGS